MADRLTDVRFEQWSDLASIGWVRLQMTQTGHGARRAFELK
jgi:hypothetical protein